MRMSCAQASVTNDTDDSKVVTRGIPVLRLRLVRVLNEAYGAATCFEVVPAGNRDAFTMVLTRNRHRIGRSHFRPIPADVIDDRCCLSA